jgi:xylan 1,4-beta-xylosidase
MKLAINLLAVLAAGAASLPVAGVAAAAEPSPPTATFEWFEYTGRDAALETPLPPGSYRNPVIAGFYPDPSVTRVGDKFYLVNSTFAYFPGIPVLESQDLVHWRQVGHVIDRPAQLDFEGHGISRGVFAPDIEYHGGTFYVINTAVDSGGNFISTAKDAAGPWSDPVWLKDLDGIDPSFFFDTDGKAYVLNNGPPEGPPQYEGHRAIWIQALDVKALRLVGPRKVLVNGGVDFSKKPIWIEGPHLYRRGEFYYLMCAEGGTGPGHSEVILRARSPWGPFEPYAGNPILTQRDLASNRRDPVVNAGHADLVEAADGTWWAVFLASRAYAGEHYNTGRETFLLPVTWRDGWPVILPAGEVVPYVVAGPKFMARSASQSPYGGNFTWRDEFDARKLNDAWLNVRVPKVRWVDLESHRGALTIHALAEPLSTLKNPSFLGRRQQHLAFDATTAIAPPVRAGVAAGIAVFQAEKSWFFFGVRQTPTGSEAFLERQRGAAPETVARAIVAGASLPAGAEPPLRLRVSANGAAYSFSYDPDGKGWRTLKSNEDGTFLSTAVAGGFTGVVLGPYARSE